MMFMRQRNVKNKEEIINNASLVIKNPVDMKEKWHLVFNNDNPIYVEIGMGKGDFIFQNALKYPDTNFIGIEKFDSILAIAIKKLPIKDMPNLRLIRMDAMSIADIFDHEVDKVFLNFSDPWPKPRHEKRRLTSLSFLSRYESIFKDKKTIEMKTDNRNLFEYSLVSFSQNKYKIEDISLDLHGDDYKDNIMTEYERKFASKGNVIYYVKVVK